MKYLVTGGAGFIGSNFIHYLFEKYPDCQVINLDKLTYAANLDSLKKFETNPHYKFVKGDIADAAVVEALVKDTDVIVNFAAETHVDRSITGPAVFIQTNVVGMQVLLDAAVKHKKRFHQVSTDEVFGDLGMGSKEKFNETTPYNPSSPYSASKAAADHLVRAYARTYGLQATISNCSNNYGPYQFPEKLIPQTIVFALQNKKIPIYGKGENIRDWIYVDDHNSALDLILQKGKAGETYLVGSSNEQTNVSVVKTILKILGKPENLIEFVFDRPGHDGRYAIDSTKIQNELGWQSKYNFVQALEETVNWYKNNESWWKK